MELWNIVAGGAALGLIASCWGKIKEIFWKFCSLFVQHVEIPSEPAHNALVAYLIKRYRRSRSTSACTAPATSTTATGATAWCRSRCSATAA